MILKELGDFRIEENANYPAGEGNLFLMKGLDCIGGADRTGNTDASGSKLWIATISVYPDENCDCVAIAEDVTREYAISALWANRFEAFI